MKRGKNYLWLHRERIAIAVVAVLLIAGAVQTALGLDYTLRLTPILLGIVTALCFLLWDACVRRKLVAVSAIVIGMFLVEVLGVQTGWVFGNYSYGDAMGYRLFGVPFTIGLTWFIVTLSAWHIVLFNPKLTKMRKVLLAGGLAVVFDIVLEQFAAVYGLWAWDGGVIPLYNYVCWFLFSIVCVGLYEWKLPKTVPSLFIASLLPMMALYFWVMVVLA